MLSDDAQIVTQRLEVDFRARRAHRVGGRSAARAKNARDLGLLGHRVQGNFGTA
jgi:hypothetical protein